MTGGDRSLAQIQTTATQASILPDDALRLVFSRFLGTQEATIIKISVKGS